jgi:MYXO-CTERM domain-containing protein
LALGCDPSPLTSAGRAPIIEGTLDSGDPAVVAIGAAPFACETAPEPFCTGTLIAPRVVLTAAHCLEQQLPETLMVFFGASVATSIGAFVDDVRIHPNYDPQTLASDVAVLHLAGPAPIGEGLPLARAPVDDSTLTLPARIVGFGVTALNERPTGDKREGTAVVSAYTETTLQLARDPAITCLADSGGPVFLDSGGAEVIAGVVSFGDPGCATQSTSTRVDVFAEFVDEYVAEMADPGPARMPIIDAEGVCEQACTRDDECPEAFPLCGAQPDGRRCERSGQVPGNLGPACATDMECGGGTCVAAASEGLRVCRCLTPCSEVEECDPNAPVPPGQPPCHPGCDCAGGQGGAGSAVLLVVVGVIVARRRRWS